MKQNVEQNKEKYYKKQPIAEVEKEEDKFGKNKKKKEFLRKRYERNDDG